MAGVPALAPQLDLFGQNDEVVTYLAGLNLDDITAREALAHLYHLRDLYHCGDG